MTNVAAVAQCIECRSQISTVSRGARGWPLPETPENNSDRLAVRWLLHVALTRHGRGGEGRVCGGGRWRQLISDSLETRDHLY